MPKIKYLRRGSAVFHLLGVDGRTAKCGMAVVGRAGYKIVEKESPPMRAMTCSNCLGGFLVGQK